MRRQRKLDPGQYQGWLQATIRYMSLIAEAQALQYEMHSADEVAELRAMATGAKKELSVGKLQLVDGNCRRTVRLLP